MPFERRVTIARAADEQRERLAKLYGEEATGVLSAIAQGAIFGSDAAVDAAKVHKQFHGHEIPDKIPPGYPNFVHDALALSASDERDPDQAKSAAFVLTGQSSSPIRQPESVQSKGDGSVAEKASVQDARSPRSGLGRVAIRRLIKARQPRVGTPA